MRSLLILPLILSSCMQFSEVDLGGASHKYTSLGGDATVEFSNGSRLTHSHTASFQHFTQAVVGISGSLAVASVSKAKTASDNLAATTQAKNASDAATANAKITADAAAQADNAAHFQTAAQNGLFTPVPLPTAH